VTGIGGINRRVCYPQYLSTAPVDNKRDGGRAKGMSGYGVWRASARSTRKTPEADHFSGVLSVR
jgi:hypothetical protein